MNWLMKRLFIFTSITMSVFASDIRSLHEPLLSNRNFIGSFSPYYLLIANSSKKTIEKHSFGLGNTGLYYFDSRLGSTSLEQPLEEILFNPYIDYSHLVSKHFIYSFTYAPFLGFRADLIVYDTEWTPFWLTIIPYGLSVALDFSLTQTWTKGSVISNGTRLEIANSTTSISISPEINTGVAYLFILGVYIGTRLTYSYDDISGPATKIFASGFSSTPYLGFHFLLVLDFNIEIGYSIQSKSVIANAATKYYFDFSKK